MKDLERTIEALRQPTRRRILLEFQADPRARTVDEVSISAGVHRTVAFNHLERLAGLGFLVSEPRRGRPGKPAKLYRPRGGALLLSHPPRRFAELAAGLAGALEGFGPAGLEAARLAGLRFGATLAGSPSLARLAPLGARYRRRGGRLLAGNCVFREACEQSRSVVCRFQAGLLESALGIRVGALGPNGSGGCQYELFGQ